MGERGREVIGLIKEFMASRDKKIEEFSETYEIQGPHTT